MITEMPRKSLEVGYTAALISTCSSFKNTTSPLLSLPQKMKDRIYGFVYSDHIIQIQQKDILRHKKDPDARLKHYLCECRFSGNQDPKATPRDILKAKFSYTPCIWCPRSNRLEISLLLTCRQMHNEARRVLYFKNTFSFTDLHTLQLFGERLSNADKLAIRRLRLVLKFERVRIEGLFKTKRGRFNEIRLAEEICLTVTDQLKRLQSIDICLVPGFNQDAITHPGFDHFSPARQSDWITSILELRDLPLESSKIVVGDEDYGVCAQLLHIRTVICSIYVPSQEPSWFLVLKEEWADHARSNFPPG